MGFLTAIPPAGQVHFHLPPLPSHTNDTPVNRFGLLPAELVAHIMVRLELDDALNLAATESRMNDIFWNEGIRGQSIFLHWRPATPGKKTLLPWKKPKPSATVDRLALLPNLPVRELLLENWPFDHHTWGHVAKHSTLRRLTLISPRFTPQALWHVRNRQITHLTIHKPRDFKPWMVGLFPNIRSLTITHGNWTSAQIAELPYLSGVKKLTLDVNHIGVHGLMTLIDHFPGVESLSLAHNRLGPLDAIRRYQANRLLTLHDQEPFEGTADALKSALERLAELKSLRDLDVSFNDLGVEGVNAIPIKDLTHLRARGNQVTQPQMLEIIQRKTHPARDALARRRPQVTSQLSFHRIHEVLRGSGSESPFRPSSRRHGTPSPQLHDDD